MCSTVDDGILPKKNWGMVVSPPAIPPPWSLGCLNILGAVSCKIIFTKEKDKQFCVRLEKCWISENIQKQFSRVNTQLRVFPLIKQILVIFYCGLKTQILDHLFLDILISHINLMSDTVGVWTFVISSFHNAPPFGNLEMVTFPK